MARKKKEICQGCPEGKEVTDKKLEVCTNCAQFIYYHAERLLVDPQHWNKYTEKLKKANWRESELVWDVRQERTRMRRQPQSARMIRVGNYGWRARAASGF